MSNELIINSTQEGCRIALLKDKSLVEFHQDTDEVQFNVGDIYLGTVSKVIQGLNAAFVDIGYEKDAFLHYLDLGPRFKSLQKFTNIAKTRKNGASKIDRFKLEPELQKLGNATDVLSKNQQVLVQVVKEPISTKGPRLSCELSIAGRYLILVPFSKSVNLSKKIANNDERKRLTRLINSIKPQGYGVIIRTVAQGKEVAELDNDLRNLVEIWEKGVLKLKNARPKEKVIGEMSKASALLRDVLNESFDNIHIDDKKMYDDVRAFTKSIAPEKEKIVKLYNGKAKIFENFGVEKQMKSAFGQSVSLRGGGYLIIEHTEALHVVDVNSGNKSNKEENQETTALSVNLESAREVARQLRLRDMGGIIVVDFIDMRSAENKKLVYKKMMDEMASDRSKFTILPLSKFGLMQITRQRVRPEMNITTREVCPSCNGTGKISASIMVSDQVEEHLDHLMRKQNSNGISIVLHPFLYSYFTKGVFSKRFGWMMKYNKWVKLIQDSSLPITEYKFMNKEIEEIEL